MELVEKYYVYKIDSTKIPGHTADVKKGDIIKGHSQDDILFGRVVNRKTKDKNPYWVFDMSELKEVKAYTAVKIGKKYQIILDIESSEDQ